MIRLLAPVRGSVSRPPDMLAHRPSRVTCATAEFKYDPFARDMAFDPAGRQPSNRLVGMITDRDIAFAQ